MRGMGDVAQLRRARPADADALVRLRREMFAAMGRTGEGWEEGAGSWFAVALDRPDETAAFVVEVDGLVVAGAVGTVRRSAPSPGDPTGVSGELWNVCTLPGHRGRGHARRVVTALLDWFDTGTAAAAVRLNATADGVALYRSLGFEEPSWPHMRRVRPSSTRDCRSPGPHCSA